MTRFLMFLIIAVSIVGMSFLVFRWAHAGERPTTALTLQTQTSVFAPGLDLAPRFICSDHRSTRLVFSEDD